ncbi:glycosyltransferase family 1 protein [Bradyrhizobium sp. SSUT112]|uniref:glycosyltransferase family 4 protein n=1 Tax=Bradyrhizobium sp. SSUT112 TaxID=3040604 RepID=UPI002446C77D|nr:glycosyltransferase family 1 protein [Bradyrhizobium sp. SSUT112]MDH2357122.1 glycosyltransferase family 1 protein [Bradyrhizobium sp. SSUT112]
MVGSLTIPLFAIRHKQIGGTEFAIYNLIRGLAQTSVQTEVFYDREQHLSPEFGAWLKGNSQIASVPSLEIPGPKNIRFLQETLFEWGRRKSGWVLYPNYFVPPRRPFSTHQASVILHDIQYKVLPNYHSAARKAWLDTYLPWLLNRADSIVLISQSEKHYVEQFFGVKPAEKCDVVYNAIDWDRFAGYESAPSNRLTELLSRPYLLTVCHQFPHKNLQTLLTAFDQLAGRHPDLQLYMVGTDSASNREFVATKLSATRERVRLLGFLSDQDLGLLYRNAKLFVLPSLYEGFGMPAVEALGLGTPILVSGTTALPEVTLGLGSYVENPKDVDAWIWQIDSMISANDRPTPATVQKLRNTYSPLSIAQSLLSVLRKRG